MPGSDIILTRGAWYAVPTGSVFSEKRLENQIIPSKLSKVHPAQKNILPGSSWAGSWSRESVRCSGLVVTRHTARRLRSSQPGWDEWEKKLPWCGGLKILVKSLISSTQISKENNHFYRVCYNINTYSVILSIYIFLTSGTIFFERSDVDFPSQFLRLDHFQTRSQL